VPPAPVSEAVIADHVGALGARGPLIVTSRIVDPAVADRLVGEGVATGAAAGEVHLRNVFAADCTHTVAADLLVPAQGRVPKDELSTPLAAAGVRVEAAGDCRSPRSLEEAVLEGTLAAQHVLSYVVP
jgi:hypothetical protein